jgi:hypothetical protein
VKSGFADGSAALKATVQIRRARTTRKRRNRNATRLENGMNQDSRVWLQSLGE